MNTTDDMQKAAISVKEKQCDWLSGGIRCYFAVTFFVIRGRFLSVTGGLVVEQTGRLRISSLDVNSHFNPMLPIATISAFSLRFSVTLSGSTRLSSFEAVQDMLVALGGIDQLRTGSTFSSSSCL